jgi:hypothetical protein
MYQAIKVLIRVLFSGLLFILAVYISANTGLAKDTEVSHDMSSHHQHIALNHALGMTLDGYNLVILGNMKMARGIDETVLNHGNMMIKSGTAMWNEIMSGTAMQGMHHGGKDPVKDPAMVYTHKLGEKQMLVIALLGKMSGVEMEHGMDVLHQTIILNHALKMALEGANSVMLGEMGMARGVDEIAVEHGRTMLKNAGGLFHETMSALNMMNIHMSGTTPESDELLEYAHRLAEAEFQVLAILEGMPGINK